MNKKVSQKILKEYLYLYSNIIHLTVLTVTGHSLVLFTLGSIAVWAKSIYI